MTASELLVDSFDRIRDGVHRAVEGLGEQDLSFRVTAGANSIAWLVWHLTRVQDDHLADAAGSDQVWTAGGWADRFGLPFEPDVTGYGQSSDEVAAVRIASADLLTGYHDAVHDRTVAWVRALTEPDYARVVDTAWNPPVTLAVRLVSVVSDDLQHVGQAGFIRGLLPHRD